VGVLILLGCNVLIAFRWMHGIRGLEFLYVIPWGISAGLLLSSQFIALIVCAPKDQVASATGVYYFFQQLGAIIGTGLGASVLRTIFRQQLFSSHLDKQVS
jgi:predicted MFS family arabinose efflux permease